ncbi:hypothetical protein [Saccharothrix sp.]|uniref:hypothetical protein n=1 Tax=Saccharothrix sp. TaxID=1873460 RepID=UPI002811AC97|nr:hypothetical protein [Saccharothrix sp.]
MTRARAVLAALTLAAIAALSSCTTSVGGTAQPESPESTQPKPAVCDRSTDPQSCTEWKPTPPAKGDALFQAWATDEASSTHMLCSALPDQQWEQWLGAGHYRYVTDGTWCELWSADNQIALKLGLFGASPLTEYSTKFRSNPSIAKYVKDLRLAGVPAIVSNIAVDEDGKGQERDQLILAPHGDANRPGVLLVTLELHPPRGKPKDTPTDRTRIGFREPLAQALLGALFPR